MKRLALLVAVIALGGILPIDGQGPVRSQAQGEAQGPEESPPGSPRVRVKLRNEISPHGIMSVFALPGEPLSLEAVPEPGGDSEYVINASCGEITRLAPNRWQWRAPDQPGLYRAQILSPASNDSMHLNLFVMHPFDHIQGEYLNGYRIGHYPEIPLNKNPIYARPHGFVEVTAENEETLISPHFKLKQFTCKQSQGHPKYVVLNERLLLALESILETVNESGYPAGTLHVMSGYRTPYYNRAIDNVQYSCHQWGMAADIFIDVDGDEKMDDINRDGKVDAGDAGFLYRLIDGSDASRQRGAGSFAGGLGRYGSTHSHGPFVHVDVRGFPARWGQ